MLTIGIYAMAYFMFGYIYGKIDNAVYFDDTPSEEAGFLKRTARILLFPVAGHKWEDRQEHFKEFYDEPLLSLRYLAGAHITHPYPDYGKSKEKFCKFMTFLWPLKLFNVSGGAVCLLTKAVLFIGAAPIKLLETAGKSAKRLAVKKFPRLTGDIAEKIEALETAGLLAKCCELVGEYLNGLDDRKAKLGRNLSDWKSLGARNFNGRVELAISSLEAEINGLKARRETLLIFLHEIQEKETALRSGVEEMGLIRKTASLSVAIAVPAGSGDTFVKSDGLAVLMKISIENTRSLISEAREILKKAENLTA